jgi:hypothetical protein
LTIPIKSISAKYQRPMRPGESQRPVRKGENMEWRRMKQIALESHVMEAKKISREVISVIGRWLLYRHLTPTEAEAARRYSYIMARFDRFFTESARTPRSQTYEFAYGEDQELMRLALNGGIDDYEEAAKKARRDYTKLVLIMGVYEDPLTKRNPLKDAIDNMCCSDIEPNANYRNEIAAVLRHVAHEFGVDVKRRRGRPKKGKRK